MDMETKPKLLIVDDDEGILRQLKWAFTDDYEVFLASTKEDALNEFSLHNPDLVALDRNLKRATLSQKKALRF